MDSMIASSGKTVTCEKGLLPELTRGDCRNCALSSYGRNCNGSPLSGGFFDIFENPDDVRLYQPVSATAAGETDTERAEMEVAHCIRVSDEDNLLVTLSTDQ